MNELQSAANQQPAAPKWSYTIWDRLTAPAKSITDFAEQRNARLAASFLISILMLNIIGGLARIPRLGLDAFSGPLGFSLWVLVPVYFLSRTKWYRIAVFIFSVIFSSLAYISMLSQGNEADFGTLLLVYLPLSLIVASSFVSAPAVFLLVGLNIGAYISLPMLGVQLPENTGPQAGIVTVIGVVLMLLDRFRQTNEKIRLEELQTINRELEILSTDLEKRGTELEQRVAERTRNLELAAEVGHSISQVRDLESMLRDAAEIIRLRFDLYYTQVYLVNQARNSLTLQAGTGTVGAELVGRGHSLPINTNSINGRAVVEKQPVIISDTAASASFRPNPLLPETRSEMAVPLMVGEKVVGVLDLQSNQSGFLDKEILPAFEALAGQLAIAIQNANLLADTEQARAEVETQAARLSRANWQDYLDAIHKPEQVGFVYEHNTVTPLPEAESLELKTDGSVFSAPISVSGESLGSLVVELDDQSRNLQTTELINTVARQVAQQIESLRLLESAERYRAEAEQASRRRTLEGWKDFMESKKQMSLGYHYDLKEVRPHHENMDIPSEASAVTLPIKVRDEAIGKLAVEGLAPDDHTSLELVNAVAERLGAHIESLRQYDQTQSALAQSEKLSVASMRFAQSADLQELLAGVYETLDIPEVNRALLGVFNYSSANELESMDIAANWWNGSGHEPSEIGRHYSIETLNVLPLFMSATPVFSNDTFHDERVNGAALELVTRQNIRSMAVLPLYLGGRQVGVLFLESEETHDFTQDETRLFTAIAPQIATVLENRRQFEHAQKQAKRESTLNVISQKIQSATSVEAVLQIAARELGHALGAPLTIAQLGMKEQGNGE